MLCSSNTARVACEVKCRVYDRLDELGWRYEDVSSIHNDGYIIRFTGPDGVTYDLDLCNYIDGPSIREEMIKLGLPKSLLDALDELNGEVVTYLSS